MLVAVLLSIQYALEDKEFEGVLDLSGGNLSF